MENLLVEILNGVASYFYKIVELTISFFTKQRRIKRVLSLKKAKRTLILPLREGKVYSSDVKIYIYEEIIALTGIVKMLSIGGYSVDIEFEEVLFEEKKISNMAFKSRSTSDYFVLGGPGANRFTCMILEKFFPSFKVPCGPTTFARYEKMGIADRFHVGDKDGPRYILYEKKGENGRFEYRKNYIVLIKMTSKDFGCKDNGTVHIMFGEGAEETKAATLLYNDYEREIYRRLKKHKKHYFIICEYCRGFGVDFNTWEDLTDIMFSE